MTEQWCEWRIDQRPPCDAPAKIKVETVGGWIWLCAVHYDELEAIKATIRSFSEGIEEEIDWLNRHAEDL